MSRYAIVRSR